MTKPILVSLLTGIFLSACTNPPSEAKQEHLRITPSFDCAAPELSSVETLICQQTELAVLDNQLAQVYARAQAKAENQQPPLLEAEQRGWIKGRNECWKSADQRLCVKESYQNRIITLQAKYRLVDYSQPVYFACDGNPAKEVVVTYFKTEPATLIAEYGDSSSLMIIQPSASGTHYQGRNEAFWEHQGEATITWGYNAPEMLCKPK
ncbi:MliC family protein [Shewanella sp. AS1]|uniref:MliC family protein n=1 Tax=Shewanella sp. AS1 TaxID=2907626 RepID=UPI001F1D320B|nr:MliC family protein [Shewanella sp. AS1]MCE9679948.1 MliC family protein [Shewanella sp. AS1]